MSSRVDRPLAVAVVGTLLIAILGEGGARPTVMLVVHAAVLLAVGRVIVGSTGFGRIRSTSVALGTLVLFLSLVVGGAIVAPYAYGALALMLEIAVFLGVVWIGTRAGPGLPGRMATPLLVGAAAMGGMAIFERLADRAARPAATFSNPNHLAAWLGAVLLLAAGSALAAQGSRAVVLRGALAMPAVVGLYLTGSRGAVLGLAAGGATLFWTAARRASPRLRNAVVVLLAAAVLVAGFGVAVRSRAFDPYRYQRIRIWRAALTPALGDPWTGVGPGQWDAGANNLTFPVESGPLRFERIVDSAHSDLVRLPAELGWPAALAALAAVGLIVRVLRRRIAAGELDDASLGAVAALVALAAQALVDNLSSRPAVYLLAAALVGGLLSARASPRGRIAAGWRAAGMLSLVWVFLAADVAPYGAWRIQSSLPRGSWTPRDRERLDSALRLNPLHPGLWLLRARSLSGEGSTWTAPLYANAREAAERAVRLQPLDARFRMGLARVEARGFALLFGDEASRSRAKASYRAAQSLAIHDAGIAIEEGSFLLRAADPEGARRAAERALAIEPNSLPARLLLAEAILATGSDDSAARASRILDDATRIEARWSEHPRETRYAEIHLVVDPTREQSVRAGIDRARNDAGGGGGP